MEAKLPSRWGVYGHAWAVALLSQSVANERVSHAYLLIGPPQIGKTTLAKALAQTLLCLHAENGQPCGQCRSCQLAQADRHPDIRLVLPTDADGKPDLAKGLLRADQMRQLGHDLALQPLEGRYKVAILRTMERACQPQTVAANIFLKTLEEPPPHVKLILTASSREALLPTLLSRCQVLQLRSLSATLVAGALQERWQVPQEQAELLAHLSGGRLGWAVQVAQSGTDLKKRNQRLEDLLNLIAQGKVARLAYAETLAGNVERALETLQTWEGWWRDLMLTQSGCDNAVINLDRRSQLAEYAQRLAAADTQAHLRLLRQTMTYLTQNVSPRLALEVLTLRMPYSSQPSTVSNQLKTSKG